MADTKGFEEAQKRFEKAKQAYENRGKVSSSETQRLLREYYAARRDMVERTPSGALGAGMLRTAGDVVFGLPDLVTEGANWLARQAGAGYQAPTLGGLFRQATGQSEGAKSPELADYYNAPGYAAAAYGIGSLAQIGWKAFKDRQLMKRAEDLLGDLNPTERNIFSNWMVKGQGSSSPEVSAMLEKLRVNPKYSEFFTAMEKEASKEALKGIVPRASTQTSEEAAVGIARTIQNKLDSVKDARKMAGNESFDKAYKVAGDAAFVDTNNTRAAIAELRGRYPDNAGVQAYLTKLEEKIPSGIDTLTNLPVTEKLTVPRIQGFLHEFGKKAEGSDSVITQLSLDDMKIVNSKLFGGLKQDLLDATKTGTTEQKKAAGYLVQAREQYAKASEAYDDLIAKGVPKWLQNKAFNEVTLEDLTKAYQKTNPAERQLFRSWVGENRAESLQALDKNVFNDFLKGTYKKLDDGTFGYDLGSMADKWSKLYETDPNKAGQIADALGTSANEFSKRMRDASVFTRKIQVGAEAAAKQPIPGELVSSVSAAVGSTPASYQGAKLTQVGLEAVNQIFKNRGLSEEQLMKIILTDEGKQFLKSAALSPQSAKTLENLTKFEGAALPGTSAALMSSVAPAPVVGKPKEVEPQWALPPELGGSVSPASLPPPPAMQEDSTQWQLPPELRQ